MKDILVLDTGKEWGGGTNSLLELLKRADRNKYRFTALFYNNYSQGGGIDVKTAMESLAVPFILCDTVRGSIASKAVKEVVRGLLFAAPALKKKYVFRHDYAERVLPASEKIASVLKREKYDLLYMNNQPSSNLEGIIAARSAGVACVQHSRIEVRLNPFEAASVNGSVKRVVCVSRGVMESLVNSGVRPELCTVVYNGVDPSAKPQLDSTEIRKRLGVPEGAHLTGTVGSLIKRKRVELLIEAVSIVKGNGADVWAVIVGAGPMENELRAKAASLGISGRVVFTGFSTDALSYMNAMDFFVFPSRQEGLPRVVLEAMLLAKPVIALNVTGPSELVVDGVTGFLLKQESGTAIASAIGSLIKDATLALRLGDAGKKRVVEEFGIERYVAGVEKVFEEVLHCST